VGAKIAESLFDFDLFASGHRRTLDLEIVQAFLVLAALRLGRIAGGQHQQDASH
jgi:hypothetical protein